MGAAAAVIICSCVFGSPNEKLFVTDDDYVLNWTLHAWLSSKCFGINEYL